MASPGPWLWVCHKLRTSQGSPGRDLPPSPLTFPHGWWAEAPSVPLPRAPPQSISQHGRLLHQKEQREGASKKAASLVITEATSHHFCQILFITNKPPVPPTLRGRCEYQKAGVNSSHFRSCCHMKKGVFVMNRIWQIGGGR